MSYPRAPYVPRKPTEYEAQAPQPSMNDLLQSLNLDDDPSLPSLAPQTTHNGRPLSPIRALDGRPVSTDLEIQHDKSRPRANAVTSQHGYKHGGGHECQSNQSVIDHGLHNTIQDQQAAGPASPAQAVGKSPDVSPQTHKVHRKPVDTTPTRRVYYSPDDLDELIPKRESSQDERAARPLPMPSSANNQGFQPSYPTSPSLNHISLPRTSDLGRASNSHSPYNGTHSSMGYTEYSDRHESYERHSGLAKSGSTQHRGSVSDLRASIGHQPYGRSPSPTYRSSMPTTQTRPYAASPAAFDINQDLTPRQPVAQYMPLSPSRQNSSPIRSQSSLSNHSARSPERETPYSHANAHSASFSSLRMPSPERNMYYANTTGNLEEDRYSTASVPPTAQARRGRQKGEIVAESDLPAMPLLFTATKRTANEYEGQELAQQPYISDNVSPSRSPTRNSNILPNRSPRKRSSFARAPDMLQSVKVLPIRPIKRPPLCLEERYHPYTFVKTNKFKIKVLPAQSTFVAGGEVFGHIDIVSEEGFRAQFGSTQVVIGEIGVEVIGYEEIQHSETGHNPRSFTFLYSRKIFQNMAETHPGRAAQEHILTSAVLNDPPPDQDGYRTPSKGTSSFPFSFPLPVDAPSSADLGVACIKYLLTGYATVKLQGSHEIMATSVSVKVVEAWDVGNPAYDQPIEAAQGRDIANYHEIAATAQVPRSLYLEGETLMGNVRIANHSSKKVREVKFLMVNRVTLFGDKRSPAFDLNPADDVSLELTASGHVEPHVIAKGDHESWNFSLHIPPEKCLSIRNTALFEVNPEVLIKISMGPLQKSTRLYIPQISVASPDSMINNQDRIAPTSAMMRWATLPFLYRFQRICDGAVQAPEKGVLEVTDLITYHTAQERVTLLNTSE